MSDTVKHEGGGVITWRWAVMIVLAVNGALLVRVLGQIDKTADLAVSLQIITSSLDSRLNAQARRIDDAGSELNRLRDWVYRTRPTSNPQP